MIYQIKVDLNQENHAVTFHIEENDNLEGASLADVLNAKLAELAKTFDSKSGMELTLDLSASDIAKLDVEAISNVLDANCHFTKINIITPNEAEKESDAIKTLQKEASQIAARNRLLQEFCIDTTPKDFHPWHDLMVYIINKIAISQHFGVVTVKYFGNYTPNFDLENSIRLQDQEAILAMGQKGFEEFLRVVFKSVSSSSGIFLKKLMLVVPKRTTEINTEFTLRDFITSCRKVQAEYPASHFPFCDITFRGNGEISSPNNRRVHFDEPLQDDFIKFLTANPHINFFESLGECLFYDEDQDFFEKFIEKIEKNNILSTLRFDIDASEEKIREYDDNLNNTLLKNRRRLQDREVYTSEPTRELPLFPGKAVPNAWHKVRAKRKPSSSAKIQYEHSTTHSSHTTVQATGYGQRMQQIAAQQERQQQLTHQDNTVNRNVYLGRLINKNTVQALRPYIRSDVSENFNTPTDYENYLKALWCKVSGEKTTIFDNITEAAMRVILLYDNTFFNGLMLNNLPEGFYIYHAHNERILCYEKANVEKRKYTALTPKLINPRNEFFTQGTYKQFIDDTKAHETNEISSNFNKYINGYANDIFDRKKALLALLKVDNEKIALEIENKFSQILESFSWANLNALRELVLNKGAMGVFRFLEKLKNLEDKGLFQSFKAAFIDCSENIIELASKEAYQAMDLLCQFDINQAVWWNALITQQARSRGRLDLVDAVNGFIYFCNELKAIDPTLQLTNPCCDVKEVTNLHVALDRLLWILKNAADPKEQLVNLDGVSLHQEDAYYAITHDGYNFVSKEMELTRDKSESNHATLSYKVSAVDLIKEAQQGKMNADFKRKFFRYVGSQRYLYPFELYRQIYVLLEKNDKLSEEIKTKLLSVIAVAATDERSLQYEPLQVIEKILNALGEVTDVDKPNKILEILEKFSGHEKKPELIEISAITHLLKNTNDLGNLAANITAFIENESVSTQALANLGNQSSPNIPVFFEYVNQCPQEPKAIRDKLIVALSKLDLGTDQNYPLTVALKNYLPDNQQMLLNFLSVLSEINVVNSTQLPALQLFDQVIENKIFSKIDIQSYLVKYCQGICFGSQSLAGYSEDCRNELIFFLEKLAEKLTPYAEYIKIAIQNLQERKTITVDDVMEMVEGIVNNSLFSLFFSVISKELEDQFISTYKNNLVAIIGNLSLSDADATALVTQVNERLSSHKNLSSVGERINNFLNAYKEISKFLRLLQKEIQHQSSKNLVAEIIRELTSNKNKEHVIKFAMDVMQYTEFTSAQKHEIFQKLVSVANAKSLLPKLAMVAKNNGELVSGILNANLEKIEDTYQVIEALQALPEANQTWLTLANTFLKHSKSVRVYEAIKNSASVVKFAVLTIVAENKEITDEQIINLCSGLSAYANNQTIQSIAKLYHFKPAPDILTLLQGVNDQKDAGAILAASQQARHESRDKSQFTFGKEDKLSLLDRLERIDDLVNETSLSSEDVKNLVEDFTTINNLAESVANLTDIELTAKLAELKKGFSNVRDDDKNALQLQLLAHLREALCRTYKTDKHVFPKNTQIAAVLHSINQGGNVISDIDTGEGKGVISALQAAMLWFSGHMVWFCTSDTLLSNRDAEEFQDFFRYLGVENFSLITAGSSPDSFKPGGIYYSNPVDFNLFRMRCALEGKALEQPSQPISLVMDEIDRIALDDASLSILSHNDGKTDSTHNPDEWIYPLVNRFVDYLDQYPRTVSPEEEEKEDEQKGKFSSCFSGKQHPFTIATEVFALREYLYMNAVDNAQKTRLLEEDLYLQLNTWIESARTARGFQEKTDFKIKNHVVKLADGTLKKYRKAVIFDDDGLPREGATWCDGAQQCLHARLNEKYKGQAGDPFICEPERKAIAVSNSNNFFDYFTRHGGRILGNTGSSGSTKELQELRKRYHFKAFKIPPHFHSVRSTSKPRICKNFDAQVAAIIEKINSVKDQPILILCKDALKVEKLQNALIKRKIGSDRIRILTGENEDEASNIHEHAGKMNTITLSSISRRGIHITPEHPKGLLMIGTDVVSYRVCTQEAGRSGRQGKPGEVVRIYNREDFEKYPEAMQATSLTASLKEVQKTFDTEGCYHREKNALFSAVAAHVQEHLHQWQEWLIQQESHALDDKLVLGFNHVHREFLNISQSVIEDLNKYWAELFQNESELVTDPQHPVFPKQKINDVRRQYIKEVTKAWERATVSLQRLCPGYPVPTFDLESTLKSSEEMKKKYEKNRSLQYYEHAVRKLSVKQPNLIHFTRKLANSQSKSAEFANIMTYRTQETAFLNENARNGVSIATQQYLTSFHLAQDRRAAAKDLLTLLEGNDVKQIITELNKKIFDSYKKDLEVNDGRLLFKRSVRSRFRDTLLGVKTNLYTVFAPSQCQELINLELDHLLNYLGLDLIQPFYQEKGQLKALVESLSGCLLKNPDGEPIKTLATALCLLDEICKHPQYDDKKSELKDIKEGLTVLFEQTKHTLSAENQIRYHTYQVCRVALQNLKINGPSTISFFNNSRYQAPENSIFETVLKQVAIPKQKYSLYHAMSTVRNQLAKKFGALDIQFSWEALDKQDKLLVSYHVLDKTGQEVSCTFALHVDLNKNTFTSSYDTTLQKNAGGALTLSPNR